MRPQAEVRPGVRVECRDGALGVVHRVERDDAGAALRLRVREESSSFVMVVPVGLIREVGDDGTVWLGATRDEARAFTPRFDENAIRLFREELVPRVESQEVGAITVRTEVEEVPETVVVEGRRERVEVEHVPMDEAVRGRVEPWREGDDLVIPLYEERVTVVKGLFLRELVRVRRVAARERRAITETVWRERAVVDDRDAPGLAREWQTRRWLDRVRATWRRVRARLSEAWDGGGFGR